MKFNLTRTSNTEVDEIELCSLVDLMVLLEEAGDSLILEIGRESHEHPYTIEIYDDYRE